MGHLSAARFQRSSSLPAMVMRPPVASSLAHSPMRRSMPATPSPVCPAARPPGEAPSAGASGSGVLKLHSGGNVLGVQACQLIDSLIGVNMRVCQGAADERPCI